MKRKGTTTRSESSRTVVNSTSSSVTEEEANQIQHQNLNDNEVSEGNGFFACYLLTSLNPNHKRSTYIGFTVNPRRRIRQHNGEIGAGAFRTKKKRPWEMVMCIYGFPTNVSALQFEWAWQHPAKSLAVRKAAAGFKSLTGLANSIKLAYTMLTLPSWQSMNITVNFFSTKYMNHCAGCPTLPGHMKVKIGSMDELPCYTEGADGLLENDYDSLDEAEFDNNSNSDSVPDVCDDSIAHDSPKSRNQRDKINESFGWNQEPEPREPPGHSFASEDPCQSFNFITSLMMKPSAAKTSSKRVETTEYTDLTCVPVKSSIDLSQPECEPSGSIPVANKNHEVKSTLIVPCEAEIIDLCTPSPSCRNVVSKKRNVSSFLGADFIDLTRSPNFVQL